MALVIRAADARDRAALVEQFLGLNRHEQAIVGDRRTDPAAAAESFEAAWQQVRATDGHALVAERDGRVVGHLFLLFRDDAVYIFRELRHFGYISELFVREEARGAGIAKALMAEAERLAVARGVGRLMLGVLAGNRPAEALYVALGFAPYAVDMVKALDRTPS